MTHVPVLLNEVTEFLRPEKCKRIIDATVNGGGHAEEILKRFPKDGILIGIDQDENILARTARKFKEDKRFKAIHGNFRDLKKLTKKYGISWDGILFDLGMSSLQLEESGRGFSFMRDEPLDMRFDINNPMTAEKIVNSWPEKELAEIFFQYGEERFARRIAGNIIRFRKQARIDSTAKLAEIIIASIPAKYRRNYLIHPATRAFQALRIAVNDELGALKEGINQAWSIIRKNGRMAAISFHSLEDRIVKHEFRNFVKNSAGSKILTKKPIGPAAQETSLNPRARSARLRVIQK